MSIQEYRVSTRNILENIYYVEFWASYITWFQSLLNLTSHTWRHLSSNLQSILLIFYLNEFRDTLQNSTPKWHFNSVVTMILLLGYRVRSVPADFCYKALTSRFYGEKTNSDKLSLESFVPSFRPYCWGEGSVVAVNSPVRHNSQIKIRQISNA